jgi:hypothetical protein
VIEITLPPKKRRPKTMPLPYTQADWPARCGFARDKANSKLWTNPGGLTLRQIDWRTWRLDESDGRLRAMIASRKTTRARAVEEMTQKLRAALSEGPR